MEKSKNNLIISVPTNSANTKNKSKKNDAKSRSHADIKPQTLKKRGVYVEKKPTNTCLNEPPDPVPVKIKCASRKKRCLASTLNTLSETTNVMQCSSSNNPNFTNHSANSSNLQNQNLNEYVDDFLCAKKKPKHKKYLDNFQNEIDDFVVQQSTKDFTFSPSNYSVSSHHNPEDIKWSEFLPRLVPKTDSEVDNEEMVRKNNHSKTNTLDKSNKDDQNVYNLFVDLIETTFNVYNVETEFDTPTLTHARSSKNSIEIAMAAPKTISRVKCTDSGDISHKRNYYNIHEDGLDDQNRYRPASPVNIGTCRRKLKSNSFFNNKKTQEFSTRSFIHQKPRASNKKSMKDNGKKHLLKMLKEQLRIDNTKHMEPQSFYQALKVMAKSKRQKTIQFDETANLGKDDDDLQRMFKKQNVISSTSTNTKTNRKSTLPSLKKTRSLRSNAQKASVPVTRKLQANIVESNMESRHSLQVFAFDTEKHGNERKKVCVSPVASFETTNVSSNEGTLYLSDDSSLFEAF